MSEKNEMVETIVADLLSRVNVEKHKEFVDAKIASGKETILNGGIAGLEFAIRYAAGPVAVGKLFGATGFESPLGVFGDPEVLAFLEARLSADEMRAVRRCVVLAEICERHRVAMVADYNAAVEKFQDEL